MSSLGRRRSRPSAFAISTIFAASVRGRAFEQPNRLHRQCRCARDDAEMSRRAGQRRAGSRRGQCRDGCRTGHPRRRQASADRADRRDRRLAAGATCHRRSGSRAGSNRRAPEPGPTDRGCDRAPEAAASARCRPEGTAATTIAATRTSTRRLIRRLIVRLRRNLTSAIPRACRSRYVLRFPDRTCPRRQAPDR